MASGSKSCFYALPFCTAILEPDFDLQQMTLVSVMSEVYMRIRNHFSPNTRNCIGAVSILEVHRSTNIVTTSTEILDPSKRVHC